LCVLTGLNQGVGGLPLKGWPLTVSYDGVLFELQFINLGDLLT